MATFNLKKGDKFAINKGVQTVLVGLGWDVSAKPGENFDVDASAYGCIHDGGGNPRFFNEGSHALVYANGDLVKGANKSFSTADGSMVHTGDNRTGAGNGDDEQMVIALGKLPAEIVEVMVFMTIYEARVRKQAFGRIANAYVQVTDKDTGRELCRYSLNQEFNDSITVQVGSLVRDGSTWSFKAVGAGSSTEELGEVINKLS